MGALPPGIKKIKLSDFPEHLLILKKEELPNGNWELVVKDLSRRDGNIYLVEGVRDEVPGGRRFTRGMA